MADPTGRPPGPNQPAPPPPPPGPNPWAPGPQGPGQPPPRPGGNSKTVLIVVLVVVVVAVLGVGAWLAAGFLLSTDPEDRSQPGPELKPVPKPTFTATVASAAGADVEAELTKREFECYQTATKPVLVRSCYRALEGVEMWVKLHLDAKSTVAGARIGGRFDTDRRARGIATYTEIAGSLAQLIAGKQKLPQIADGQGNEETGAWGYTFVNVSNSSADYQFGRLGFVPRMTSGLQMPEADLRAALEPKGYACDDRTCTMEFKDEPAGLTTFSVVANNIAWTARLSQMRPSDEVSQRLGLPRFAEVGSLALGGQGAELEAWLQEHWKRPTTQSADFGNIHVELRYAEPLGPTFRISPVTPW